MWCIGAWLFWLLLISQVSTTEIIVGALAAAVSATGAFLVAARDGVSFRVTADHLRAMLERLPASLARDTGWVLLAMGQRLLGRHVRGRMVELPFDYGRSDDAREEARRALVIAGVSLTPNSIAIWLRRDVLVVHRLLPQLPLPDDPRWPL